MEFQRAQQKFISAGMALTPPDLVPAGKYSLLKNMRAYLPGSLQVRPGQVNVQSGLGALVHSLKRFRDDVVNGTSYRMAGVDGNLYLAAVNVNMILIDSGYSGNPLSIVTFRPTQSVQPWQYIGDSTRMRKVRPDGANYPIGIDPPTTAPSVAFAAPNYVQQESFDAVGSWVNGGTAGAIAVGSRVNTTVGTIVYDTGTTGWCSINPASFDQIQTGAIFMIGSGATLENLLVTSTSRSLPATTIQSITYDTGNTGLCTIQPVSATAPAGDSGESTSPFSETDPDGGNTTGVLYPNFIPNQRENHPVGLVQDALITLGGTETVRVLSVNNGPTGVASFRCSTVNNHAAGETCSGLAAFRCFLNNNHVATEALSGSAFQVSISPGIGFVQNNQAYALGVIGSRPIQPSDEINISLRIDNLQNFVEAKIIFDLDPAHSYSNNFYQIDIRQNDILAGVKNSVTMASARQRAIQRRFVDQTRETFRRPERNTHGFIEETDNTDDSGFDLNTDIPVDPITQTPTGDNQWFDFRFKVSDLDRVGVDYSKGLADVQGIRVQFNASATLTASIDALWVGGTYGPDIGDLGAPYVYRDRYRSTLTGAKSNPGPPTRSGLAAHRQRVQINSTASADGQVDKIDHFRWGGVVTSWVYIGSSPNSNAAFFDDFHDQDILSNPTLDFDNFAPFPVQDIPRSGICNVAGTSVSKVSGDSFNTSWGPGVVINIDGFPYTLYNQPNSSTLLEIVESAGTKNGVPWFISEPLLLHQNMPIIFGPTEGTGFLFGFGNALQMGTVFWCKNNDPDSAPETNQVDMVSPSESLMNGCLYDGRVIVASIKRFFQLIPSFDQENKYTPIELPVGKGVLSRWGFCVGPYIWFVSTDGIEQTDTGPAVNISGDLYPIFPHDGQPGVATNGVQPPDFSFAQAKFIRLSYCHGMLYFDFKDITGSLATLIYDVAMKAWVSYDVYASPVAIHYAEEEQGTNSILTGSSNGKIMQLSGTTDNGVSIPYEVDPPYFDAGDSRARKLFGDVIIDYNNNSVGNVSVVIKADNGASVIPSAPATIGNAARGQSVIDLNSGAGTTNRNLTAIISGNSSAGVQLFEWQPSFIPKPEDSLLRFTDWNDAGYAGAKFVQGCVIEADTSNDPRTIEIHDDNDVVQATLNAQHNGQSEKAYSFPPFVTHNLRLVPKDTFSWRLFKIRWVFEPMPELAVNWTTQGTTNDQQGYQHIRDGYIALISTTDVTLTITMDGVSIPYNILSTGGVHLKRYFQSQPVKGKIITYSLTSASGFRLFRKDCEVRVKSWNDPGGYRVVNPFGDEHRLQGAAI